LIVEALRELGHHRALVVHGAPGMDEISPTGPTEVAELDRGTVRRHRITPADLGVEGGPVEELAGGEPADNARVITEVLSGSLRTAARSAVVLNAAAAIYAGGLTESLADAVVRAEESLDSGAAMAKLEQLRDASNRG
jgi:anthranilate phosphoribosyltransferase